MNKQIKTLLEQSGVDFFVHSIIQDNLEQGKYNPLWRQGCEQALTDLVQRVVKKTLSTIEDKNRFEIPDWVIEDVYNEFGINHESNE